MSLPEQVADWQMFMIKRRNDMHSSMERLLFLLVELKISKDAWYILKHESTLLYVTKKIREEYD